MESAKKILFILNPLSGGKNKMRILKKLNRFDKELAQRMEIVFTQHVGHGRELATKAVMEGYDLIIAGGGDGTINEIGSSVLESGTPIGIFPLGSGNGLATHLKIKKDLYQFVENINNWEFQEIDVYTINKRLFFNLAGVGFDAEISKKFETKTKRGFMGYFLEIINEFHRYKSKKYILEVNGKIYKEEAFFITFANSTQFGNEARIAPEASVTDGLIDICIAKKIPLYQLLYYGIIMRMGKIHWSKKIKIIKSDKVIVEREKKDLVHVDGEALYMDTHLEIKLFPKKLRILKNKLSTHKI